MGLRLAHAVEIDPASTPRVPRRRPIIVLRSSGASGTRFGFGTGRGNGAGRGTGSGVGSLRGASPRIRLEGRHPPLHRPDAPGHMRPEPALLAAEEPPSPGHGRGFGLQDHERHRMAHQPGPGARGLAAAGEKIAPRRARRWPSRYPAPPSAGAGARSGRACAGGSRRARPAGRRTRCVRSTASDRPGVSGMPAPPIGPSASASSVGVPKEDVGAVLAHQRPCGPGIVPEPSHQPLQGHGFEVHLAALHQHACRWTYRDGRCAPA